MGAHMGCVCRGRSEREDAFIAKDGEGIGGAGVRRKDCDLVQNFGVREILLRKVDRRIVSRLLGAGPDARLRDGKKLLHSYIGEVEFVEHASASGDEGMSTSVHPGTNGCHGSLTDLRIDDVQRTVVVEVAGYAVILGDLRTQAICQRCPFMEM